LVGLSVPMNNTGRERAGAREDACSDLLRMTIAKNDPGGVSCDGDSRIGRRETKQQGGGGKKVWNDT